MCAFPPSFGRTFYPDRPNNSKPETQNSKLILNRTITLKDTWAKEAQKK